jgi:predicted short-subunit dehydrogenase-like oxidoreductase (DUF2520 family)
VGTAFAVDLGLAGVELRIASRTPERAQALARRVPGARAGTLAEALGGAGLALLTVSDDALAAVAQQVAGLVPAGELPAVLHTNGFHGLAILAPLAARGLPVGKVHPLTAVPAGGLAGRMRGAWLATAGSPAAEPWIARLVRAVEGRALALGDPERDSRRLHAAAALLSGGLVALFDAALAAARSPTVAQDPLADALRALLRATASNLESFEPAEALTGPLARGSLELVHGHLAALEAVDAELAGLYRALGARMLRLAREHGGLDAGRARALATILAPSDGPRA